MGRRPSAEQGAATARITVRLLEEMAGQWRAEAAAVGMTTSDWVRVQVSAAMSSQPAGWVGRRPPRRREGLGRAVPPPVDPALVVQLVRIGSNLNQIARVLNASRGPLDLSGLVIMQAIARDIDQVLVGGLPGPRRDR